MKQKTARLYVVNSLLDSNTQCNIKYRGRILATFDTIRHAVTWAYSEGFTKVVWDDTGKKFKGGLK